MPLGLMICECSYCTAAHQRRPQRKTREYPIFKREDSQFHIPSGVHHMAVSNGWVTIAMVGNVLYRFNIQNPRAVDSESFNAPLPPPSPAPSPCSLRDQA